MKKSKAEQVFSAFNHVFLIAFGFLMLIPLLSVLATSLSSPIAVNTGKVFLWPVEFTFASWQYILNISRIWKSLLLTVGVTVAAAALSLLLNSLMAYPLSKKEFAIGKYILMGITFTMIFKAPTIPYFLAVRRMGLFDNILVLILPHIFVTFNLIVMVTFMRQFPKELEESAMIEGCGYMRTLFMIVLPSSKAMLATIGLFYAVMVWNQFTHPLLFIQNQNLYTIQMTIRSFIIGDERILDPLSLGLARPYNEKTVRAAVVIFCILPVLLVYPYIQKYFIKGVMVGSVKG